jgi:hypothetical protein
MTVTKVAVAKESSVAQATTVSVTATTIGGILERFLSSQVGCKKGFGKKFSLTFESALYPASER